MIGSRWFWISAFIATRAVLIAALAWVTDGREVASDVDAHIMLIREPLAILMGSAHPDIASYAPLQGLVTWPLFSVLSSAATPFVAFRLMFVVVELATFAMLIALLERVVQSRGLRHLMLIIFILAPYQFLTTTVFVQDEIIAQFWVVLAALLLSRDRHGPALLALAMGTLTGKVFLLLPWFFIAVFAQPVSKAPWRAIIGSGTLIALVYAVSMAAALNSGGAVPLVDFVPGANYSVTVWALLVTAVDGGSATLKQWSLVFSLIAQTALVIYCLVRSRFLKYSLDYTVLLVAPVALFFATFYQHNAEYPVLFAPLALLLWRDPIRPLLVAGVLAFAWAPKLFFGLMNIGIINANASDTRNDILGSTVDRLGINFEQLHALGIVAYTTLYVVMVAFVLTRVGPKSGFAS